MLDEGGVPGDRTGDNRRVTRGCPLEHLAERLGVHERLVLQYAIEQPDRREHELQRPPRVESRPGRLDLGTQPAAPRGAPACDGDFAHPESPCLFARYLETIKGSSRKCNS